MLVVVLFNRVCIEYSVLRVTTQVDPIALGSYTEQLLVSMARLVLFQRFS